MNRKKRLAFPMTTIDANATASGRAEIADRLVAFSRQLCVRYVSKERRKAAEAVLSGAFLEWAVADNPGITEFTDLIFAVETCLTDYDASMHDYYAAAATKGGPSGAIVALNMLALGSQSDKAVEQAAHDAYEAIFQYMLAEGLIQKTSKAARQA